MSDPVDENNRNSCTGTAFLAAAAEFVGSQTSPCLVKKKGNSNIPPVDGEMVRLEDFRQDKKEEFDNTTREAKFAFRSSDLGSFWASSSTGKQQNTDSDAKIFQHWALVVHFPRGKKTFFFEAWKDKNGFLQPGRADGVDYEVFESATYIDTLMTSPFQIVEIAKQVPTGLHYHAIKNNCQSWLRDFLRLIHPKLLETLYLKLPDTNPDQTN